MHISHVPLLVFTFYFTTESRYILYAAPVFVTKLKLPVELILLAIKIISFLFYIKVFSRFIIQIYNP